MDNNCRENSFHQVYDPVSYVWHNRNVVFSHNSVYFPWNMSPHFWLFKVNCSFRIYWKFKYFHLCVISTFLVDIRVFFFLYIRSWGFLFIVDKGFQFRNGCSFTSYFFKFSVKFFVIFSWFSLLFSVPSPQYY